MGVKVTEREGALAAVAERPRRHRRSNHYPRFTPDDWQPMPPRPASFYLEFREVDVIRTQELSRSVLEIVMHPKDVVPVLQRAHVDYVLLGLYGIMGWMKEPRVTQDVDVLVAKKHLKRALEAICKVFPHLKLHDTPVVVRFFEQDKAVLDIMKPHHALFVEALKSATERQLWNLKVRVPVLEMALTLKFFSMTSPGRKEEDKHQDAHDFIHLVKSNTNADLSKLRVWGELAYSGGGMDLVKMVEDVRAGRKLEI
ncbi:MAG: hypothetical protein ABSE73_10645 [Planctomycetota bacterium]